MRSHSRFGLYFYSNLYERASRVPRDVKKTDFFLQLKWLSFCTKIAPKRHKLQKIIKIEQKCQKNPCFLRVFQIFFNLGAILVHQTSNGVFNGPWLIFWNPWDPWWRIHIEGIKILVCFFRFLIGLVVPPTTFFQTIQYKD